MIVCPNKPHYGLARDIGVVILETAALCIFLRPEVVFYKPSLGARG